MIYCRHTSASLVIHENAAPAARRDLEILVRADRMSEQRIRT